MVRHLDDPWNRGGQIPRHKRFQSKTNHLRGGVEFILLGKCPIGLADMSVAVQPLDLLCRRQVERDGFFEIQSPDAINIIVNETAIAQFMPKGCKVLCALDASFICLIGIRCHD